MYAKIMDDVELDGWLSWRLWICTIRRVLAVAD